MRIVTWNCGGALRRKRIALEPLEADILVIQECENPAVSRDVPYRQWAGDHLWIGTNKDKGLGVFVKPGIELELIDLDPGRLELFLPCRVAGISMLAVWTKQANSPTFGYIGQLWKWLRRHGRFLSARNAILIGDLNSNARWDVWDRWWNHSDVVNDLGRRGLTSVYHHSCHEAQGAETEPTFFLHRKTARPYHIDYAFLSSALLEGARVTVGAPESWLPSSDHMPVVVDLAR
jgi:exonuclease III